LALWQANHIKDRIQRQRPGLLVTIKTIQTQGDKILDTPLALVGGKGLFVKEIENELIGGTIDLAVHSMKDVPTELPAELEISVIPEREDPRDALLARSAKTIDGLPKGAKVGTSSLRRQAQLLARRPDITIAGLRGNVGTRIRKMTENNLDAIILAAAGLIRMGQQELITRYLDPEEFLPAVSQGALGIETRKADTKTRGLVMFLNHGLTAQAVAAERSFLARLEGGCQVPIAGHATIANGKLTLTGLVGAVDGSELIKDAISGRPEEGPALGKALAEKLLGMGGERILKKVYGA
jgi:hydroxymethylbilane synthase